MDSADGVREEMVRAGLWEAADFRDPARDIGAAWEVVERLKSEGVCFERPNTYGAGTGVTYDQETLKVTWEQMAADSQVDLLLHTWATGVRVDGGRVAGVRVWNKGGERWVGASVVVDASGDADISAFAGADYEDLHSSGKVQSLSTLFRLANVDVELATRTRKADMWALMREAAAKYDPFSVLVPIEPGEAQARLSQLLPFIGAMTARNGCATAYVCHEFTCSEPATDAAGLAERLSRTIATEK
jgi:hypothetical protein